MKNNPILDLKFLNRVHGKQFSFFMSNICLKQHNSLFYLTVVIFYQFIDHIHVFDFKCCIIL